MNNTISSSDTYANDRADSHINMMQKQREGWELREGWDGKQVTFAGGKTYEMPAKEKPKTLRDILVEHGIGAFKEQANEK